MLDEAHRRFARSLAEVIEQLYDVERPRERRIELIQHHVERAIIHRASSCSIVEQFNKGDETMNDIRRMWAGAAEFGDDITAADIFAALEVQLRSLIAWLDARRNNELFLTEISGDIEISPEEMERMIGGLKQNADACATAVQMTRTSAAPE